MAKGLKGKVTIVAVVLVMTILMMVACTGQDKGNSTTETESKGTAGETKAAQEEPVEISMYGPLFSSTLFESGVQDDPISKEIEKRIGVKISIDTNADREGTRLNAMLASGDLPDLIMVNDKKYLQPLIDGNNIIPLDELIQTYGKDILADTPVKVEFSKKYYSNDTGKLYIIPGDDGVNSPNFEASIGAKVRWDYYKELGYPKYNNMFDLLPILADMQKNHPTTADGKKVYGLSGWLNEWGLWNYIVFAQVWHGVFAEYPGFMDVDVENATAKSYITNENSTLWDGVRFFNKANRLGILDPDVYTQKSEQSLEKIKAGRVLFGYAGWMTDSANQELAAKGDTDKGFVVLPPPEGTTKYFNGERKPTGKNWALWGISANSKHPEKAMALLNLMMSNEGTVLFRDGIEGVHWDEVDGKPQIKQEVYEANKKDTEAFLKETGVGKYAGWTTRAGGAIYPRFNTVNDFWSLPETFEKRMTELDKDYCAYYNCKYPAQFLEKIEHLYINDVVSGALPIPPDDIKRIDDSMQTYLVTNCMKLVMEAKTDEEFEAGRTKIVAELNKIGLEKSVAFWSKAYQDAKVIADQYDDLKK